MSKICGSTISSNEATFKFIHDMSILVYYSQTCVSELGS